MAAKNASRYGSKMQEARTGVIARPGLDIPRETGDQIAALIAELRSRDVPEAEIKRATAFNAPLQFPEVFVFADRSFSDPVARKQAIRAAVSNNADRVVATASAQEVSRNSSETSASTASPAPVSPTATSGDAVAELSTEMIKSTLYVLTLGIAVGRTLKAAKESLGMGLSLQTPAAANP